MNQPDYTHGVMEGEGFYNKYAKLPAGGAALAMPFLEEAARLVATDAFSKPGSSGAARPVVIADYGSS